ncbi:MAG: lysophospholipid acyltransferase family protein [bacterium]
MKLRTKMALRIQRWVGWITFPAWGSILIGLMRFGARYKVVELREIRKRYKQLKRSQKGPLLICANHLTKIDSAILNWSFASIWSYMRSFKAFSWNLPERANFYNNSILRILCYFGSCVPVDRGGSRDAVKKSLDKITYLLKKGHPVTVFPEGGRSRSGRVDTEGFTYSVGRLVKKVENCQVLCVYLRSHKQETYSNIPRRGSRFYLNMELMKPTSPYRGLRATREIAAQIVNKLTQMEEVYFASVGR